MKTWKSVTEKLNNYIDYLERQNELKAMLIKEHIGLRKKSIRELEYLRSRMDSHIERETINKCIEIIEKVYE